MRDMKTDLTTMTLPRWLRNEIAERGKAGETLADVLTRELGLSSKKGENKNAGEAREATPAGIGTTCHNLGHGHGGAKVV